MNADRILAYAQLMRLPNVFTLIADVAMALCAISATTPRWEAVTLLMLGSILFYLGGMVSNDYFDRHADAATQAFRPIPSGRVSARSAALLMVVLFALGWVCLVQAHAYAPREPFFLGVSVYPWALFACILMYNVSLKHTPAGPLAMGACRFFNILMILNFGRYEPELWHHLAGIVGVYIAGVTWLARSEDRLSERWQLVGAGLVMSLALVMMILLPLHLPRGSVPFYYLFLTAGFVLVVAGPVLAAVAEPAPRIVQNAVKNSIKSLILMDAALATAFVGWPGLLLVLLFFPARRLGRWVYST